MMQTNEKLNISILFFICESTVGYMSLSKADAICMSGCFYLGIFLHISHSRIPFTFDHICFFYIVKRGTPNTFNSVCLWLLKHEA